MWIPQAGYAQRIPDGSYPKAQDLFAFFVLAYFARSYIGVPDVSCHHYRFGTGLTGHNAMPLDKFAVHCTQSRVSQGIRHFLEQEGTLAQYHKEYRRIHDNLVFECMWNWLRNLVPSDQGRGFELLLESWGSEDVSACLVWRREYDKAIDGLRTALAKAREEATRLRTALTKAREEETRLRQSLAVVQESWSFRIGSALLFVPRKIYDWWKRGARSS